MIKMSLTATTTALMLALLPVGAAGAADHHGHAGHDHGHHGQAVDDHANHQSPAVAAPPQSITLKLPDVVLRDQEGRARRLVSDVMDDKIIVANFVYTNCTTICPVASALFSQVQDRLGSLLDSKVRLVSLSVDPARDTPARLKSYAESHNGRPGWVWLTGAPGEVAAALKGFGAYTANYKDHPVMIMIGDSRSGQWMRYYGFQDPDRLAARIKEVIAARSPGAVAMARQD